VVGDGMGNEQALCADPCRDSVEGRLEDYGMYEESERLCSLSDKGEFCLPLVGEMMGSCSGNTTFVETSGSFSDGMGEYQNDADCSWIIAPPGNSTLAITFSAFDLEDCCDFVRVYECESEACLDPTLITTVEGRETVISPTGKAKITFTSDGSVTYDGFAARWGSTRFDAEFGAVAEMLNVGVSESPAAWCCVWCKAVRSNNWSAGQMTCSGCFDNEYEDEYECATDVDGNYCGLLYYTAQNDNNGLEVRDPGGTWQLPSRRSRRCVPLHPNAASARMM